MINEESKLRWKFIMIGIASVLAWPSTKKRLDPFTQYTLEHIFTHAAFCLSDIITFFGFIVGVKFPLSVQKVTLDSQISVCYSVC